MDNDESIAEIYKTYYVRMLNFAKKYVPEPDAEDIVQNVFMTLIANKEWLEKVILKLEHPYELRCILFTFVRNACCNFYRRLKNKSKIFSSIFDSEYEICINPEYEYQNINMIESIMLFLKNIDKKNRNIFIKYYIEGYSIREIVEQSEFSKRSVESRLRRTKDFLKNKILRREYF
jgi:RNA polymerase sigma factor (sigma-70 family)